MFVRKYIEQSEATSVEVLIMFSIKSHTQRVNVLKYFLASTFVFTFFASALSAQVTASLSGSVKDATGAIIPEASVTIKSTETGTTRTAQTDANGNYNVLSL